MGALCAAYSMVRWQCPAAVPAVQAAKAGSATDAHAPANAPLTGKLVAPVAALALAGRARNARC